METVWILCGIIVLLLAMMVWEKKRFDGRERDLLNRLMSRDFGQYVDGTTRMQKPPQRSSGTTTIEDAVNTLADEGMLAHEKREPPAVVRVS